MARTNFLERLSNYTDFTFRRVKAKEGLKLLHNTAYVRTHLVLVIVLAVVAVVVVVVVVVVRARVYLVVVKVAYLGVVMASDNAESDSLRFACS